MILIWLELKTIFEQMILNNMNLYCWNYKVNKLSNKFCHKKNIKSNKGTIFLVMD